MSESGNSCVLYVPAGSGLQKLAFAVAPLGTWHTVSEACSVNGNFVMPTGNVRAEKQIGMGCKASGYCALVSCTSMLKQPRDQTTGRPVLFSITSSPCSLAPERSTSDGNTIWDDSPLECSESVTEIVRLPDLGCPIVVTDVPAEQALTPSRIGTHAETAAR